jgi:ribonucleotide monophosphatase NagD (HAD superfamily)
MSEAAGLLLDIDGVLAISWETIDGSPEALGRIRQWELPARFVTNTTSASRTEISRRVPATGMDVPEDEILSARPPPSPGSSGNGPARPAI